MIMEPRKLAGFQGDGGSEAHPIFLSARLPHEARGLKAALELVKYGGRISVEPGHKEVHRCIKLCTAAGISTSA